MKNSKTLSEKIKGYSLFATGILASAVACNAQVVYTDVDPDYSGHSYNDDLFFIDLNNDGIIDFTVAANSSYNYWASYSFTNSIKIDPASGNSVAGSSNFPLPFDSGNVIDSNLIWRSGGGQILGSASFGWWADYFYGNFLGQGEKFVGVRFTSSGEQHYGWIRLSVDYYAGSYTVHDYAYEETPNKAIVAGDTGAIATCQIPISLSTVNIGAASAKLKWDAVAGTEEYKIRYKVTGINPWTLKYSTGNAKTLYNLSPNTNYTWQVKSHCSVTPGLSSDWSPKQTFTTGPLRMGDDLIQLISFQIYPNPAEDHSTIQFTLPQSSHVYIKVYDVNGKEIATLLDGDVEQGDHSLRFNTNHFSKGVYLVKMISEFRIENQKLIVQ